MLFYVLCKRAASRDPRLPVLPCSPQSGVRPRARARVEWVTQCGQPITARKEPLPGDLERKKALGY
jgi:hypothetical protein